MNFSNFAVVQGAGWRWCQYVLWLVSLACTLMLHGQAAAQPQAAATVNFATGVVTATASGAAARPLAKGAGIFARDTIDTADNGRVQMRFTDGGLVSLMPRTTFSIEEYLHDAQSSDDSSLVFGMLRGGMRTVTGSIGKVNHEQYQLRTPVATLGIRGTEFIAVLNPPNTLRVHVGKGKIVLTNDHGTLEVPEGRNAVVKLGGAPEFSDQPPRYAAAGLGGDIAHPGGLVDEDPYLTQPRLDMSGGSLQTSDTLQSPAPDTPSTPGVPAAPGVPSIPEPPLDPGPSLPSVPGLGDVPVTGSGFNMAGLTSAGTSDPGFYQSLPSPASFSATFDPTGNLVQVDGDSTIDLGTLVTANVGSFAHNISWGEFTGGSGTLGNTGRTLEAGHYLPYVIGAAVQALPASTLSYTLAGATPARSSLGTAGTLQYFNLDINLGASFYDYGMGVNLGGVDYGASGNSTQSPLQGNQHGFQFDAVPGGVMAYGDICTSCGASFQGFLAGPNAEQAGINYQIRDADGQAITGAAALTRQ